LSLVVKIYSFSFIYGNIPFDNSGNGGGFVFDCRFINNPGRLPELMILTGKDEPVQKFLQGQPEMTEFLNNVYSIIDKAVENYISRNFESLMISFGCTGGRHRSVYSAENLYSHLKDKYPQLVLNLKHLEI